MHRMIIRRACRQASGTLCVGQRRWAQVHDVRFLASHSNPGAKIQAKYLDKLKEKAQKEGHHDVNELKQAYADKITELRKKAAVPGATAPLNTSTTVAKIPYQAPPPPVAQTQASGDSHAKDYTSEQKAGVKTLAAYVDVDKVKQLPAKEIEALWRLRHVRDAQSLCAVVTTDVYSKIAETAKKHPQFILPLPREEQGAEIHFLQWTFPTPTTATVLFTHLAEYKLRGEYSQPHTTVTHHLDLAGDKGVVLVQGTVLPDRGVSVEEGKFLLLCLQKFYSQTTETTPRKELLGKFTRGDSDFSVDQLLAEAEKIP